MVVNLQDYVPYGNIEIPTSHVSPYAVDESVLLYEPALEDIVIGENRNIFNNVMISAREEELLAEFIKYVCDNHLVNNDKWREILDWLYSMEPEFLRFLYSCNFDHGKTIECMFMNYKFRRSSLLPARLDDIEQELRGGYLYWFGRDLKRRPTLIADVFKLQGLSMEKIVKLLVFCFEFFLRYLHVGGRSENYNVLIDCEKRGVVQIPVHMIIQLTEIMSSKYRGRLNSLFLVSAPSLINIVMRPLKGVLPDRILNKITILREDSNEVLLSMYDPGQLQKRFGGSFPDLVDKYYPFQFFPSKPVGTDLPGGASETLSLGAPVLDPAVLFKIPPSTLYGTCMATTSLSGLLKQAGLEDPEKSSGYLDKSGNPGMKGLAVGNDWLRNIRSYLLSPELGKYLIDRFPELATEIRSCVVQKSVDLECFIGNLNVL